VSHNLATIRDFAREALLLDRGEVVAFGPTDEVIGRYVGSDAARVDVELGSLPRFDATYGTIARLERIRLNHQHGVVQPYEDLAYTLWVRTVARADLDDVVLSLTIFKADGSPVGSCFSTGELNLRSGRAGVFDVLVPNHNLAPGQYYLCVGIEAGPKRGASSVLDVVLETVHFEIAHLLSPEGELVTWHDRWGATRFPNLQVRECESSA
jgi:lipopolysaccharide transport system ATP-binding protein